MKKMKLLTILSVTAVMLLMLAGCGAENYADGTYTGKSSVYESTEDDEGGDGYGEVTVTVENGVVTTCDFQVYEADGTLKDENYGKQDGEVANADFYNKAQKGLAGAKEYAKQLEQTGDYHAIDAISGATVSYNQFMEAVNDALSKAKQ